MARIPHPATSEKIYTGEELEFLRAIAEYKRVNRRPFPSWSEVLAVVHALGYRKVAAADGEEEETSPPVQR